MLKALSRVFNAMDWWARSGIITADLAKSIHIVFDAKRLLHCTAYSKVNCMHLNTVILEVTSSAPGSEHLQS